MGGHECGVKTTAFVGKDIFSHLYAMVAKNGYATSSHTRIRISRPDDHTPYSAVDQKIGTRRRLSVVRARFESHIYGSTAQERRISHRAHGIDFGMRPAETAMEAFADNAASVSDNHSSHHRVGRNLPHAAARQFNGTAHIEYILIGNHVTTRNKPA